MPRIGDIKHLPAQLPDAVLGGARALGRMTGLVQHSDVFERINKPVIQPGCGWHDPKLYAAWEGFVVAGIVGPLAFAAGCTLLPTLALCLLALAIWRYVSSFTSF